MFQKFKDRLKCWPRVYDLLDRFRALERGTQQWLDGFSRALAGKVNFIQIGASDGLRWDPVRRFVIRNNWNGILVEPLPPVFEMLKKNYAHVRSRNLIFANVAISSGKRDTIRFWSVCDEYCKSLSMEDRLFLLRKSSTDREMVIASLKGADDKGKWIQAYDVPCLTVATLIDRYWRGAPIDLIVCDAEGHDDQVIRSIDFDRFRPLAILYESHNLKDRKEPTRRFLEERHYTVTDLGGDSVAVRSTVGDRHSSMGHAIDTV